MGHNWKKTSRYGKTMFKFWVINNSALIKSFKAYINGK